MDWSVEHAAARQAESSAYLCDPQMAGILEAFLLSWVSSAVDSHYQCTSGQGGVACGEANRHASEFRRATQIGSRPYAECRGAPFPKKAFSDVVQNVR